MQRVLVPGAGLGRLALEIASKGKYNLWYLLIRSGIRLTPNLPGYAAQGNEFSYHMLFASNFILNWYVYDSLFIASDGF